MSEREVRDSESGEPVHTTQNALVYSDTVAGLPCNVAYVLARDQCVRGKICFLTKHANDNQYITDFENIKELLVEKYGRAISPFGAQGDQYWLNDLYADDYQEWGTAIGAGHLIYASKWQTKDTDIVLILNGDNFEISMDIEYVSKELGALEDQQQREHNLADL